MTGANCLKVVFRSWWGASGNVTTQSGGELPLVLGGRHTTLLRRHKLGSSRTLLWPPLNFLKPFLPVGRIRAHINEIEFLVEVFCTVTWGGDSENLAVMGIADNSCANMWMTKGHARRGAGLRLTRAFHHWMIRCKYRYFSFYCRSGHNTSAVFLSRASDLEIDEWVKGKNLTQIAHFPKWDAFCAMGEKLKSNHCLDTDAPPITRTVTGRRPNTRSDEGV